MIPGTSSVSTPTRRGVISSRTSSSTNPFPTVFSNAHPLQPRVNQVSGCCANKVVINLSTALVIPDYSLYYNGPAESFQPTYYALDDGSLITPPFIEDLAGANVSLLVTGMLTMLFVRNIIVSGDYLRRGKVKNKTLFYVLFLSQILAPVSLVPLIMSYFNQFLNCTVVIILSCVTGTVSLALLITGILGVKAYKCLNNSRFVLIMLGLFQCGSSGIVAMDITSMRGERRLSGSCIRVSDLLCTRIFILIQFVESLFLCGCFLYACWRSGGSKAARGRISIQLSMEDLPIDVPLDNTEQQPTRRGWWDYVPNTQAATSSQTLPDPKQNSFSPVRLWLAGLRSRADSKSPISQSTGVPISETSFGQQPKAPGNRTLAARRGTSPTPSSFSRFSKLVPNMVLFQKVMKDELLYTTFITATCVVVAVLAIIGVNFKNGLTVPGWIALNWAVISLLAIHSFGRVVRRHERDALLQHPSTCNAIARAGNTIAEKKQQELPLPLSRYRREAEGSDRDDPFSDTRRLGGSRASWDSEVPITPLSLAFPVEPAEHSRIISSAPASPSRSLNSGSFPLSSHNAPLVPHRPSLEDTRVEDFSQSWLMEPASFSTNGDQSMRSEENDYR